MGEAARLLGAVRASAGLRQDEVARRAGITQSTVSAYESGRREPTLPMLAKLLDAMGHEVELRARPVPDRLHALPGAMGRRVRVHRRRITAIADRHGLRDVAVGGALARGEAGDHLELTLDLAPGARLSGLRAAADELATLMGAPVDLILRERRDPTDRENDVPLRFGHEK